MRPGLVLGWLGVSLCSLGTVAHADEASGLRRLEVGAKLPAIYQAAPAPGSGKPLVVFLHGMCATPEWECPVFRGAAGSAWLLCPPGPAACEGGGAMWVGTTRALTGRVNRTTEALTSIESLDLTRRALVGYSLGAPAALRIALDKPGAYQRLMFVNASVAPSKAQLERARVTRVAFVAGESDATASKQKRAAKDLARVGVDARYFSLGRVGHYFDASSEERMRPALEWLTADW